MSELISERVVVPLEDGSAYSDVVTIEYADNGDGGKVIFYCHPDVLFDIVKEGIVNMSQVKTDYDTSGMSEEQIALKKRVVAMMRAGLKALLLTAGDLILTLFLGKEHEQPPKAKKGEKFDLVDWYMDMFTKIGISYMMKNDTILTGRIARVDRDIHVYTVDSIAARPVTLEAGREQR